MKKTDIYDCVVIGGGPAGLMAAGRAAELGANVLVLEKNRIVGKKLSYTGGGRCNITNAELDVRKFLEHFPKEKNFLHSPFAQFSAEDTFAFFEKRKLPLVVEARGRAFPHTQSAQDVVDTMLTYARESGAKLRYNTTVTEVQSQSDTCTIITNGNERIHARMVVVAAGGVAAPQTGSTGDGFTILNKLGHTIHDPNPHIVPLTTDATWVHALSGVDWSFMQIRFVQNGKTFLKRVGKVLFTHFGISGPLVLNCAHEVANALAYGSVDAHINLFPDTDEGALDTRVIKLFAQNSNKLLKNVLPELLHKELARTIIERVDHTLADTPVHSISKESRKQLVKTMQNLTFPITGTLGMGKATIADGGVDLREIDTKTLRSRIHQNVYAIGDTLHINRPSGGYSLQLCWTTGFVAGSDIGKRCAN